MTEDIHGTDHAKLPQVVGFGVPNGRYEATIFLSFVPTAAQLKSTFEHLRSWTPPDA